MKTRVTDLSFPVLCLPDDLGLSVASNPNEILRCQAVLFWRAQYFVGLKLVEPDGSTYEVLEARVQKPTSSFGQWLVRVIDLPISVELTLKPVSPTSLENIRKSVEDAIDRDAETFEEFSGHDVPWWRDKLKQVSSVPDLMQLFKPC